jgi:hypothetical protein
MDQGAVSAIIRLRNPQSSRARSCEECSPEERKLAICHEGKRLESRVDIDSSADRSLNSGARPDIVARPADVLYGLRRFQ